MTMEANMYTNDVKSKKDQIKLLIALQTIAPSPISA